MSDTPDTDAVIETIGEAYIGADGTSSSPREIIDPDFARTLERQRNEARKDFNDLVVDGQEHFMKNLTAERDALRAELTAANFMDQWGWMKKCAEKEKEIEDLKLEILYLVNKPVES